MVYSYTFLPCKCVFLKLKTSLAFHKSHEMWQRMRPAMPGWVSGRNSMNNNNGAGQKQRDSPTRLDIETPRNHMKSLFHSRWRYWLCSSPSFFEFCPTLGFSNIGVQSLTMSGIFRQEPGWEVRTVRNSRVGDHGVMFRWDPIDTIIVLIVWIWAWMAPNLQDLEEFESVQTGSYHKSWIQSRQFNNFSQVATPCFNCLIHFSRSSNHLEGQQWNFFHFVRPNMGAVSKVLLWFIQTVQT
jgi:hypothetical protein